MTGHGANLGTLCRSLLAGDSERRGTGVPPVVRIMGGTPMPP